MTKQVTSCGAGPCTMISDWEDDKRREEFRVYSSQLPSCLTRPSILNMPMSAHSVHNPSRHRIRSSSYETFHERFNTRRWPISRDHRKSSFNLVILECPLMGDLDSWPYPEHRDVWDRIENTFDTEEDFEDLRIQDFVLAGRQTARRRLDRLTMPRGQTSVLE